MREFIEGSMAVARGVSVCRPHVVSAYPITPQTHIVEHLSQLVANGELDSQFINVESEFGAASVVLGAAAAGGRAYSATTSQGLLLMGEVLFNISGMRLPMVITVANRAISAPINIWNDHSDAMVLRDAGWIMLFAEDNQEVQDMHIQAYKIGETPEISLPVMVNMDGFILTHAFEPVDTIAQKDADDFLPPFKPEVMLDVKNPLTMGPLAEPTYYLETRYRLQEAMLEAKPIVKQVAKEFKEKFGRWYGDVIDEYRMDDADTVFVAMGSLCGTLKDTIDDLRSKGEKVGLLKIRLYRPFPGDEIVEALKDKKKVIIMEKAISLGAHGMLSDEIKAAFYETEYHPEISNTFIGLGGRDIPKSSLVNVYNQVKDKQQEDLFVDLKTELV
ncbi:MAG: pyruvate ferredoxin oxidoreductase [candidate division Zixibacteria bacterium]|nr:pyruvate ferredoxin oxidoreductase [candidate division Zixibacteria bacterium]